MRAMTCGGLQITVFGQSHAPEVGVHADGLPAGFPVNLQALQQFLDRRAPGRQPWSTSRQEPDVPEFLCGLEDGRTTGGRLTAVMRNLDFRQQDYASILRTPRPGHADFTARVKYGDTLDLSGGGPFSGRMTAPLCILGGICRQMLAVRGIDVRARIVSIAGVTDSSPFPESVENKVFPAVSDKAAEKMIAAIERAKADGDSVGGICECIVSGLPAGLGGPLSEGMESRISQLIFAIPAVKGVEFGEGFGASLLRGSENNDAFCLENGVVRTATNHAGGILGGITNGMPLCFRTAFKPTPSIARPQRTVDLDTMQETTVCVTGRHDPCIVPRAVPVVEAAAAIAVLGAILEEEPA